MADAEQNEKNNEYDVQKLESAEKSIDTTFDSYVKSTEQTQNVLKNAQGALKQSKQAMLEANAEELAQEATQQGIVSVSEALAMMEREEAAEKEYEEQAAQYMAGAASAFADSVQNGTKLFLSEAGDMAHEMGASMFSTGGLLSLAAGAGVAFLPDAVQGPAGQMVKGWLKLDKENDTDVDPKFIPGYESAEDAADAAVNDNTQTPPGEPGGTGSDANTEKPLPQGSGYKPTSKNDATAVSDSDLDNMANLDVFLDEMSDYLENSGSGLLKSIGVIVDAAKESDTGKKIVKEFADKLTEGKDDDKQQEGDDGPDY